LLQAILDKQGQQVGDGQCWSLPAELLKLQSVNGQAPDQYNFGDSVNFPDDVAPGDVIHFYDYCKFKHTDSDGSWNEYFAGDQASEGNHIAVAWKVDGNKIVVLESNMNGNLNVGHGTYDLADKYEGDIEAYRCRPNDSG